ncbi:NUMOD4 motif-containing HNH endonuclease [Mycobacteroides abscessus]|uniref:NUMOD4 motif-containing HNH endonuclease n=1 Tax=Mycobacteroides abscessus TaxID=36809 RepID=UPI000C2570C4
MARVGENWLPVVGYEGRYEVSDQGRIRSLDQLVDYIDGRSGKLCARRSKGRVLKPGAAPSGHLHVVLGGAKTMTIHHAVAEAFHGPRPIGAEVRHRNGDPADNRANNLEYGSRGQNAEDSKRHGTHFHAGLTTCKRGHDLTDPDNLQKAAQGRKRTCLACRRDRAALYRAGSRVISDGFCINGHPNTPENRYTNGPGRSRCKPCVIERRERSA